MTPDAIPESLHRWWESQYQTVQEFGRVLLHERSAGPSLIGFFELIAHRHPKLRSVRMTNALHAFWRKAPGTRAFELALRHCATPLEIDHFAALVAGALTCDEATARFEAENSAETPFADVTRWLSAHQRPPQRD